MKVFAPYPFCLGLPHRALRHAWILACTGFGLANPVLQAAPILGAGILGSVFNTNYQKSASNSTGASVEDGRREDIDGGGQPAGSTSSHASAFAEPGRLHLALEVVATAAIALPTYWGHSANASGNASLSDTFRVERSGAAEGTLVDVLVTFGVDAAVSSVQGGAFLEGTLAVRAGNDAVVEVQYQNSGAPTPISSVVINRQTQPISIADGQESIVAKLRTGTTYQLDAILQGRVDASADINPGLDESARIPFSRGTVDAANTAHIGLMPLEAGVTIVGSNGADYAFADVGPTLLGSASPNGPYVAVTAARVDFLNQQVIAPVAEGSQQFYRFAGRLPWTILGASVKDGQIHVRY